MPAHLKVAQKFIENAVRSRKLWESTETWPSSLFGIDHLGSPMKRSEGRELCPGGRSRLALKECKTFNRFGVRRGVFSWNLVMQSYPGNLCDLANSYLEFRSRRIWNPKTLSRAPRRSLLFSISGLFWEIFLLDMQGSRHYELERQSLALREV